MGGRHGSRKATCLSSHLRTILDLLFFWPLENRSCCSPAAPSCPHPKNYYCNLGMKSIAPNRPYSNNKIEAGKRRGEEHSFVTHTASFPPHCYSLSYCHEAPNCYFSTSSQHWPSAPPMTRREFQYWLQSTGTLQMEEGPTHPKQGRKRQLPPAS